MATQFDKLLVFDLDETLVHSRYYQDLEGRPKQRPDHYPGGDIATWERPGVEDFMAWCLEAFRGVGVWTAGSYGYAAEILPNFCDFDALTFVWGRERCGSRRDMETQETHWVKDIRKLRKFGYPKSQILCVDNLPENFARSYGNYIEVLPFEGDPSDDELPRLRRYLETLGPMPNVRSIEKRGWRATSQP